jgi:hypothetical protein
MPGLQVPVGPLAGILCVPAASRATREFVPSTSTLSMDQRNLWTSYPSSCTAVQSPATLGMAMDLRMTYFAKRNEIFFHITSQLAARLNVMDLKIFRTSALLASPAVTLEYPLAKPSIRVPV